MEQLDEILRDATAAIEPVYFRLPLHGGPPVYRERVYCYELYHQMRNLWPSADVTPYTLNGEIDKRAHAVLEELGVNGQKPDLLVHHASHMDNFAIIEVKHPETGTKAIKKDLETLSLFMNRVGYQRAIYLIYGTEGENMIDRVLKQAGNVQRTRSIELWLHSEEGQEARHVATLM